MAKLSYLLIFSFCLFSNLKVASQETNFSGKVVTFDSIPIANALIQIKSSKQQILSDSMGVFNAHIQPKDKIKVSANGFLKQNIKIDKNKNAIVVNLKLIKGEQNCDLAIESGHVRNPVNFQKVVQLNNDKSSDFSQYTTVYKLIQGQFPNVEINYQGQVIIRGYRSTTEGASGALIVLDGVVSDEGVLTSLSPLSIKSIKILASGATIKYGPGAVNGVLEIETKGYGD